MSNPKQSFLRRHWRQFWRDWREDVKQQVIWGIVLALLILGGQYWKGLIPRNQLGSNLRDIAWPYLALAFGFAIYHAIRSVVVVYQDDQRELQNLRRDGSVDGELYRILISPKSAAWELYRDALRVAGETREATIDCDILLEMYLVNVSESKLFIRDVDLLAQIDGEWEQFERQDGFFAWEFDGTNYEHGITYNRAERRTEPLRPLVQAFPAELEPGKPLEGWIRFVATEVNPEKLTSNQEYKLVIIDSLGAQHPVVKRSTKERRGEITLHRV